MGNRQIGASPRECAPLIVVVIFLVWALPDHARLRKIGIAYTATSPCQAVWVAAKEVGLLKKHKLELWPATRPSPTKPPCARPKA